MRGKPFSPQRWTALTLGLLLAVFAGTAGLVFFIDPFEIYRQATRFTPPIASGTQSYSNAGIAKSYDYDSIIIGSSMTENFVPSQLDSLFGDQALDISTDITVLENMMAREGLTEDPIHKTQAEQAQKAQQTQPKPQEPKTMEEELGEGITLEL